MCGRSEDMDIDQEDENIWFPSPRSQSPTGPHCFCKHSDGEYANASERGRREGEGEQQQYKSQALGIQNHYKLDQYWAAI